MTTVQTVTKSQQPKQIVCEHGRRKAYCKECGGIGICEHGRQKRQCKECGGIGICEHGRQKAYCKECGGSGICEHGRQKAYCKECGGSGFCEHGRHKRQCKECGGSGFCEHGRRKTRCKQCGGSGKKRKLAVAQSTDEEDTEKKTKDNFKRLRQLRKEFVERVVPNYLPSIAILIGKYFFNNK